MPRPWRTIYKSAHKEVKIRPRSGQRAKSASGTGNPDLAVIAIGLGAVMAAYSLVLEFWPLVLIVLVLHGMRSKRRR